VISQSNLVIAGSPRNVSKYSRFFIREGMYGGKRFVALIVHTELS